MEGLVTKKVVGTMVLMVVLLFSTQALSAEASGVETYMTPQSITSNNLDNNKITVSTNVSGINSLQFHPDTGEGWKKRRANYSYTFDYAWSYNSGKKYNYRGKVVSQTYGPG